MLPVAKSTYHRLPSGIRMMSVDEPKRRRYGHSLKEIAARIQTSGSQDTITDVGKDERALQAFGIVTALDEVSHDDRSCSSSMTAEVDRIGDVRVRCEVRLDFWQRGIATATASGQCKTLIRGPTKILASSRIDFFPIQPADIGNEDFVGAGLQCKSERISKPVAVDATAIAV